MTRLNRRRIASRVALSARSRSSWWTGDYASASATKDSCIQRPSTMIRLRFPDGGGNDASDCFCNGYMDLSCWPRRLVVRAGGGSA